MASRDASPPVDQLPDGSTFRIGIVTAAWNADITNALRDGARQTLERAGVLPDMIEQLDVPGSFELPWGARHLISTGTYDAVICLGCLIHGETKHDEYIAQAVAIGITQLSLTSGIPVVFGVLTTETEDQARERAGGTHGNKGAEAAATALSLAAIRSASAAQKKKIGY